MTSELDYQISPYRIRQILYTKRIIKQIVKRSKLEQLIYIFCSRYLLLAICHVLFVDLL